MHVTNSPLLITGSEMFLFTKAKPFNDYKGQFFMTSARNIINWSFFDHSVTPKKDSAFLMLAL